MNFNSCGWLTHGISFEPEQIAVCCLSCHIGGGNLVLKQYYDGRPVNWDEIFEEKDKLIEENLNGEINPKCEGCFNIKQGEWNEKERYFDYIHFTHWTTCNCDCVYCYSHEHKDFYNFQNIYNILPIMQDMLDKNLIRPGKVTFAGGEPTILSEFEELIDLLVNNDFGETVVHSNGVKYSSALARGIEAGCVSVVVSIDSGCKETYKSIKNQNTYAKVLKHLKDYAEKEDKTKPPLVFSKFVVVPRFNDCMEEVNKWLQETVNNGIRGVKFDIEHLWFAKQRELNALPQYLKEIIDYVEKESKRLGLYLEFYNTAKIYVENKEQYANDAYVFMNYSEG